MLAGRWNASPLWLKLYVFLSVCWCGSYSAAVAFPRIQLKRTQRIKIQRPIRRERNLCLASISHHFRELVLFGVFLVITLSNDHISMSHFCLYYVAMTEHNMTYKHTQVQKLRLGAIWLWFWGFSANLNCALKAWASKHVKGLLQGTLLWTYMH